MSHEKPGTGHFLGIRELSRDELLTYLGNARSFVEILSRDIKKVPALRGKSIVNLFLEPSTRTRISFELAGKMLSADTINIGSSDSSILKGETLLDTARNIQAMKPDVLVVRHKESGAPWFLAKHLRGISVVNGGDGMHEHPTQALLDLLSLMQVFGDFERLSSLKVAIVGDVRHSRVARSNIWAHLLLGNSVTIVAPPTLIPVGFRESFSNEIKISYDLKEGIRDADVIVCLRMQLERQSEHFVPSLEEYSREYCVTSKLVEEVAPKAFVMHPGPINRGVEVESMLIDGPRSLVEKQVTMGVAVRMSVLFAAATRAFSEIHTDSSHQGVFNE